MTTKVIGGRSVELDADGHLAHRGDWNEQIAKELAQEEGIPRLTERHWLVLNFMKKQFDAKGDAHSIR